MKGSRNSLKPSETLGAKNFNARLFPPGYLNGLLMDAILTYLFFVGLVSVDVIKL